MSAHRYHPSGQPRILVVDDDAAMREMISNVLADKGYEVCMAEGGSFAEQIIQQGFLPDLVLMDLLMPDQDGLTTLRKLQEQHPSIRVIMLSGMAGTRQVVEAIKLGAYEYMSKPILPAELAAMVADSLAEKHGAGSALHPMANIVEELDGGIFLAASPSMHVLYEQARRIAPTNLPILILGESGTGKEILARLIHKHSARAQRNFLKLNCAALPAELLESELFGYEQGAFTGANSNKAGKFELGHNGTMLLDEIGELSPLLQAKLLQVLQDGTFERLGGRKTIKVDVRLIACTNVNIQKALSSGAFREDLYYRLNACVLQVPPLRERIGDIPLLLRHYAAEYAGLYSCPVPSLSRVLINACCRFPWPGNVRELCSFVKRLLMIRNENAMLRDLEEQTLQLPRRFQPGAEELRSLSLPPLDWGE